MLGYAKVDEHGNVSDTKDTSVMYLDKDGEDREINASVLFSYIFSYKTRLVRRMMFTSTILYFHLQALLISILIVEFSKLTSY